MGLLNTILGRTKPVQSDLDALFALPSASITLQSAAGLSCSGHAGVCFKPPTGQGFEDMQAEVVKLLAMDGSEGLQKTEDAYGYQWLVVENADIEALVTQIHMVNSSLADAGWGPQLLCSVFGIAHLPGVGPRCRVGPPVPRRTPVPGWTPVPGRTSTSPPPRTPCRSRRPAPAMCWHRPPTSSTCSSGEPSIRSCPSGHEQRDTEQELKLKSLVTDDLTIEPDLDRWFPLWELPVG